MLPMNRETEEEFLLKRRKAQFEKAVRDLEEAGKALEKFGYRVEIKAYKAEE